MNHLQLSDLLPIDPDYFRQVLTPEGIQLWVVTLVSLWVGHGVLSRLTDSFLAVNVVQLQQLLQCDGSMRCQVELQRQCMKMS